MPNSESASNYSDYCQYYIKAYASLVCVRPYPISFGYILALDNNFIMQTNRAVPPQGKVVYYRSDGTGRDSYIRDHNGGLLTKDRIHKLVQFKPPRERNFTFSHAKYGRHPYEYKTGGANKFVHYVSDGSGRDHYVGSNEGGNSYPHRWRNETDFYFKSTLRDHAKLPRVDPENVDVYMKSQTKFVGTNQRFHRTMSSFQVEQSRRLSNHKKTPQPPAVDTYFRQGFDTAREFRKKQYGLNS